MHTQPPEFHFLATGIGSVPFTDIDETCRQIIDLFPFSPFWPQHVRRSLLEDMSIQFSEGLPLIEIDENARSLTLSHTREREAALADFYERFLSQDTESFKMTPRFAPGLFALIEHVKESSGDIGPYIKGQIVGPVTFTAGIRGVDGKPILHDTELSEAMASGLAIKAIWQVETLASSGLRPIIFLDEPYLSGFGSAFSPIGRNDVVDLLRMPMDYLRLHSDALVGIHCCGNTDWSMILEAGPDVVNFDAFDYMDHFLLYPDDIKTFVTKGGSIAWGIAPTAGFRGDETVMQLCEILERGLDILEETGLPRRLLSERSMLTPSCGMGTMSCDSADAVMKLLASISSKIKL